MHCTVWRSTCPYGEPQLGRRGLYSPVGGESRAGYDQMALWLYPQQGELSGGTQLLLMKADTFSSSQSLKVQLDEKNYLLIPSGLKERGLDYDLAKFKVIEQETDTESMI